MRQALALVSLLVAGATATSHAVAQSSGPVDRVVVRSIAHFDLGAATLKPEDRPALLSEVASLKNVTWQKIVATGHTDSTGSLPLNARLSQRRAAAVKAYLVRNGIDADLVRTEGRAARDPVAPNDSADGRAQNRRTEIRFEGIRTAMTN